VTICDPIPWYIQRREAKARGFAKGGWFFVTYDGTPLIGPCKSPQACSTHLATDEQQTSNVIKLGGDDDYDHPHGASVTRKGI
jgi:hypothetical protein